VPQICSQCGSINSEAVEVCAFCDASFQPTADQDLEPVAVGVSIEVPEWQREVAVRLEAYRRRRGRAVPNDSQVTLPFVEKREALQPEPPAPPPRRAVRPQPKPRPVERVEISVEQPELDFSALDSNAHPQEDLAPVAGLGERRAAGLLDAMFLILAYSGFLGLFRSLGGQFAINRVDAGIYAAAFFMFYVLYFSLFMVFRGATPGMQLRHLVAVQLDSSPPDTRQFAWRSLGYALSGATLGLGFLWSVLDGDQLTWHDRISQTYLTKAGVLEEPASFGIGPGAHTFSEK
jgi:uncharacterized RDD family membrane protein YckC